MITNVSRGLALSLALLCAASPAAAKDKKPVDPNKRTCRTEGDTGSIMPKHICHTAAEWAAIDHSATNSTPYIDSRGHQGGLGVRQGD